MVYRQIVGSSVLRSTLFGIGLLVLSSGCATIVSGPTQTIGVASIPAGAHVSINDELRGETPLMTPVSRRRNHTVRIEKPGYQPVETTLTRHVNGWVFGNLLIGGPLGTGIDAATGAIFEVEPDRIFATLEPQGQPPVPEQAAPQSQAVSQPASVPPIAPPSLSMPQQQRKAQWDVMQVQLLYYVVPLFSMPDPNSERLGRVYHGVNVKVIENRGTWLYIETPDERRGWLVREWMQN